MPARGGHIVLVFAAAFLLLAGCGGKKVIPADKLADIYADMFLADQWLRDHPDSRELADSTLFYDPIFERYGYSFEDFDHSMQYYTSVPDEFSEITTQVSEKLRKLGLRLDEVNKLRKETLAEYENVDRNMRTSTSVLTPCGQEDGCCGRRRKLLTAPRPILLPHRSRKTPSAWKPDTNPGGLMSSPR